MGYDLRSQEAMLSVGGPHIGGETLDVNPNDGLILVGAEEEDNCLQLWDLRKVSHCVSIIDWKGGIKDSDKHWVKHNENEYKSHQQVLGADAALLHCAMFSRDGTKIVAGGGNGSNSIRAFNYADGQLISAIYDIPQSVYSVDYMYEKDNFIFSTGDGTLSFVKIKSSKKEK